jgi:hypothetical protein
MQKYVNGELVDMTPAEITAFQDGQKVDPAKALAAKRAAMSCSKMQGILTLGEVKWGEVLTYREDVDTTWAEKMIIDSAQDWQRTSENIAFFGYLLGYTDTQMDNMFTAAALVEA